MRNAFALTLVVLAAAFNPGCHCAGSGTITSNGDAGPRDFHQLNCHCRVNFNGGLCPGGSNEFDVEICLPPNLNNSLDPSANTIDQTTFDNDVKAFCETNVGDDVKDIIFMLKSAACPN